MAEDLQDRKKHGYHFRSLDASSGLVITGSSGGRRSIVHRTWWRRVNVVWAENQLTPDEDKQILDTHDGSKSDMVGTYVLGRKVVLSPISRSYCSEIYWSMARRL